MNSQLGQIRALIEANELNLARERLNKFLEDNPDNAQGWFLASFVQPTPEIRLASIKHAAKLSPNQLEIQQRLVKLEAAVGKKKKASRLPVFALIVAALAIALVLAVVLLNSNTSPASNELPTLAVLQAVTDVPTKQIATIESVSEKQPLLTTSMPSPMPQATLADTALASSVVATINSPAKPTLVAQTVLGSTDVPTPVLTSSQVTANPNVNLGSSTTSTPTSVVPTQPTLATPKITPTLIQVTPASHAINLTEGEFRVVDATRGAESMMQSLGGSFPPAPANQSWLLLELLLVCRDSTTCAFDPASLKITGSSGASYSYSPELKLEPVFGTITQSNQIWGYLGYIIPTHETTLELTLSENGQSYRISLG